MTEKKFPYQTFLLGWTFSVMNIISSLKDFFIIIIILTAHKCALCLRTEIHIISFFLKARMKKLLKMRTFKFFLFKSGGTVSMPPRPLIDHKQENCCQVLELQLWNATTLNTTNPLLYIQQKEITLFMASWHLSYIKLNSSRCTYTYTILGLIHLSLLRSIYTHTHTGTTKASPRREVSSIAFLSYSRGREQYYCLKVNIWPITYNCWVSFICIVYWWT